MLSRRPPLHLPHSRWTSRTLGNHWNVMGWLQPPYRPRFPDRACSIMSGILRQGPHFRDWSVPGADTRYSL